MRFHLYFRQYCSTIDMFVKSFQACRTGSSSFALREISISLIQGMRNLLFPIDVLDNKKGEPAGKEAFHGTVQARGALTHTWHARLRNGPSRCHPSTFQRT